MVYEVIQGSVIKTRITITGGNAGNIRLTPTMLKYLGCKVGDYVAIKCEFSEKYKQNYIGIGKLRIENAEEEKEE